MKHIGDQWITIKKGSLQTTILLEQDKIRLSR